jgi:predicted dehydrogenase
MLTVLSGVGLTTGRMGSSAQLGIGLLGAGGWAAAAHIPSYLECEGASLVAICDPDVQRARALAEKFGIDRVYTDPDALIDDPDVQMVDVCTTTDTHEAMSRAVIAVGKHLLSEKPIAARAAAAAELASLAAARSVKTKVAYTFRYSPAVLELIRLIRSGFFGEIFHLHGLEQNPQFLDPQTPLRQVPPDDGSGHLLPSSITEYGSHLVNLMRACGGEVRAVASSMQGFIPERRLRDRDGLQRVAIEDGTVGLLEFESGAQGLLQTSHVAIGAGPGVELRVYGSEAAAVVRLVVERGVLETFHVATRHAPEFQPLDIPLNGLSIHKRPDASWSQIYFRNLVRHYVAEILEDRGGDCDFADSAKSQLLLDTIVLAHRRRQWLGVPAHP